MRFEAEHRFSAPPTAVVGILADPEFYLALDLPDLSRPEVVEHRPLPASGAASGEEALVELRYEYTGHLDPFVRRLLGGDRLTWTQEVRVSARGGTLSFRADANPSMLRGEAHFTLEGAEGATLRRIEGDVHVALPGFGSMAERRIVPGVLARLDAEAAALELRAAGP